MILQEGGIDTRSVGSARTGAGRLPKADARRRSRRRPHRSCSPVRRARSSSRPGPLPRAWRRARAADRRARRDRPPRRPRVARVRRENDGSQLQAVPNGSCRTSFSEFDWHAPRLQPRLRIGHSAVDRHADVHMVAMPRAEHGKRGVSETHAPATVARFLIACRKRAYRRTVCRRSAYPCCGR
jgi:hypothetical protein